jgi:ABC-type transport system involved in multi-copper enzyme maturation permease subunit
MTLWQKWVSANPVFRYHLFGQTKLMVRRPLWQVVLLCVPFAAIYLWLVEQTVQHGMPYLSVGLECLTLWLVAPLMSHALFAMEFEKATWDMLVLTRLTAGQIVMGKFLSRLALLALLTFFFAPLVLIGAFKDFQTLSSASIVQWFIETQLVAFGWAVLLTSFTLWLSYWLKRGMVAAAVAFAGQVFVLFILPVLWGLFLALFAMAGERHIDLFAFEAFGEGWLKYGWMLDFRFAVWSYNPAFAIVGTFIFATERGSEKPFLWGTWQGIVYLTLSALIIALLTRAIAKATRKPI